VGWGVCVRGGGSESGVCCVCGVCEDVCVVMLGLGARPSHVVPVAVAVVPRPPLPSPVTHAQRSLNPFLVPGTPVSQLSVSIVPHQSVLPWPTAASSQQQFWSLAGSVGRQLRDSSTHAYGLASFGLLAFLSGSWLAFFRRRCVQDEYSMSLSAITKFVPIAASLSSCRHAICSSRRAVLHVEGCLLPAACIVLLVWQGVPGTLWPYLHPGGVEPGGLVVATRRV
jgi:hypothetical protein